jgi:phosphatidylserine decarboxylase
MQYLLPQHAITQLVHRITRVENPAVKNWLIRSFMRRFDVDMHEAEIQDCTRFPNFNAFFTRALRAECRPIATGKKNVACPVDGCVSQVGEIEQGRIFQAKGRSYSVLELLAGNAAIADEFSNGAFATLYLSPSDYHRIHMPVDGSLRQMSYVPGRLFSVNPPTTRAVPRLFARNERVAAFFDTPAGRMGMVMVGALNVASIETVWAGEVTPPRRREIATWKYEDKDISLTKGSEMGRFNMGSTVILLFGRKRVAWEGSLLPGAKLRMGKAIGTIL